ncbi:hypothetical protein GGI15_001230 [Coemansia interrupta]|uniref:Uncharacterized protein n=1 Tax=Coemansia interrupta TaxID=1126814 RepID=A0A9W8LP38_9FUNG|nr:hypothetical protein GGI15_001230 [Coemansia interrupta]
MVHDLRMPFSDDADSASVVRLRQQMASNSNSVLERSSEKTVTGLRFSRDIAHQMIGSWCYDNVYLFDLNHEDICGICQQDISKLDVGSDQLARSGIDASGLDKALSPAETGFLFLSFDSFVTSMLSSSLSQAAAAVSFAIRQLEDEGPHPSELALEDLLPLKDLQLPPNNGKLQQMLTALYTDAGLERRRVRSILYNNRACVTASTFRQKWRQVFELRLKEVLSDTMCPHSAEDIHTELEGIRGDVRSAYRDVVIASDLNRYNLMARFNHLLLTWDKARLDCMMFALALRPLLDSHTCLASDSCSEHSFGCNIRSQARINCLRADFGDLSYRMSEFGSRLNSDLNTIRTLADEIGEHGNLVNRIRGNEHNSPSVCYMFHVCERYFELSAKLSQQLSETARCISDLLERATVRYVYGDAADYLAAMNCLMTCYELLSMSADDTTGVGCTFGRSLFPDLGSATESGQAHSLYLWHSHLPSIGSSMGSTRPEVNGLCVETMPTFPLDEAIQHVSPDGLSGDSSSEPVSSSESSVGPSSLMTDTVMRLDGSDDTNSIGTPGPHYQHQRSSNSSIVGHCNVQTIKDVNFVFDRYVASGSDDGRVFIWDRDSMDIVQILRGDSEIVNNVEGHPGLPVVAVSGIDSEIYLFSLPQGGPSAVHRRNFPLVRSQQLSAAGITGGAAMSEFVDMVYCPDPYLEELRLSGILPLTGHVDYSQLAKKIPRTFPAVSTSCIDDMGSIIGENEHMLHTGLAHMSLARRLRSTIMLGGLFGTDESSDYDTQISDDGDDRGYRDVADTQESERRRSRWLRNSYTPTDDDSVYSSDSNSSE